LITAKDSAAQGDFYKILRENNSGITVEFYPVSVQGKHAIDEILTAIKSTQDQKYDAVVLIRGGGSLEDLSAFNDESVTRAIFACKNITLVAVGHERDESISEFAADIRASTPSQAAYYIVVNNSKFITSLELQVEQIHDQIHQSIFDLTEQVNRHELLNNILNLFRSYESRLQNFNIDIESRLGRVVGKYSSIASSVDVSLCNFESHIKSTIKQINYLENLLNSYNPVNVVKRGYAIVRDVKGKIITSVTQVGIGEPVELTLKNGKLKTSINSIETINS
jgi:exodeoxyribonuclease VII large subunit